MKKIALILIVLAFQGGVVLAQMHPPHGPKNMASELKTRLKLSDEQVKKVESIYSGNHKKMEALFESERTNHEEIKKSIDLLMENTNQEIEKILNKEQKEKFLKILEARENEMDDRMPPPPPPSDEDF